MMPSTAQNTPAIFRVCSGQNRKPGGWTWGICLAETELCPWWRAEDARGRVRTFATSATAERARLKLEAAVCGRADLSPLAEAARTLRDAARSAYGRAVHAAVNAMQAAE